MTTFCQMKVYRNDVKKWSWQTQDLSGPGRLWNVILRSFKRLRDYQPTPLLNNIKVTKYDRSSSIKTKKTPTLFKLQIQSN